MTRLPTAVSNLPEWGSIKCGILMIMLFGNALCKTEKTSQPSIISSQSVITTTSQPDITTEQTAASQEHPVRPRDNIPLATLNRQNNDDEEGPFNTGLLTGIVIGAFLLVFMVTAITTAVMRYRNDTRMEMTNRGRNEDVEADNKEMEERENGVSRKIRLVPEPKMLDIVVKDWFLV
ncbi:hypothetical protein LSAT2_016980 [Lamellibrachia satsuma]|nr:hypothetical protein LSAT2_016980 [Lamellibrachia satsuma]